MAGPLACRNCVFTSNLTLQSEIKEMYKTMRNTDTNESTETFYTPGAGHSQAMAIRQSIQNTGIKYHDSEADLIARFKQGGREITFNEKNEPEAIYDGSNLPLSIALIRWSVDNRHVADGRTLPKSDTGSGRPGIDAKANYPDAASKSAYISQHGYENWEKLPLKSPTTSEVIYKEDFFRLTTAEKAKRIGEDPDILSRLPSRPKDTQAQFQANIERAKSRHKLELDQMHLGQLNQR